MKPGLIGVTGRLQILRTRWLTTRQLSAIVEECHGSVQLGSILLLHNAGPEVPKAQLRILFLVIFSKDQEDHALAAIQDRRGYYRSLSTRIVRISSRWHQSLDAQIVGFVLKSDSANFDESFLFKEEIRSQWTIF